LGNQDLFFPRYRVSWATKTFFVQDTEFLGLPRPFLSKIPSFLGNQDLFCPKYNPFQKNQTENTQNKPHFLIQNSGLVHDKKRASASTYGACKRNVLMRNPG
jgi:hypothetical protein